MMHFTCKKYGHCIYRYLSHQTCILLLSFLIKSPTGALAPPLCTFMHMQTHTHLSNEYASSDQTQWLDRHCYLLPFHSSVLPLSFTLSHVVFFNNLFSEAISLSSFLLCVFLCFRYGPHIYFHPIWSNSNWWEHGFVYVPDERSAKTCRHLEERYTTHSVCIKLSSNFLTRRPKILLNGLITLSHPRLFFFSVGSQVLASGSVQVSRFTLLHSGALEICPVNFEDSGEYVCIAASSEGTINATATLTVWSKTCTHMHYIQLNYSIYIF